MNLLLQKLQDLGLSEKEAAVYVASLELGPQPVQDIAERSKVNRATTYVVIEALVKMGLMSSFEREKKTFFVAESPENIKRLIEQQQKMLENRSRDLESIITELEGHKNTAGERPTVRYFEGIKGVGAVQGEFLRTQTKEATSFTRLDTVLKIFPKQSDATNLRISRKIWSKILYTQESGPFAGANDPTKLRAAKFVPLEKYDFNGDITISDDKVMISSYEGQPVGVIIEHEAITKVFKALFAVAWDGVPKDNDKTG